MYSAVIVAAGMGKRANLGYNKMLHRIDGQSLIQITVDKFCKYPHFSEVIVVVSNDEVDVMKAELNSFSNALIVTGGAERMDSVACGVKAARNDVVFVHDGARIFIDDQLLDRLTNDLKPGIGLALATNAIETTLVVEDGVITKVLNRDSLYNMQTPQVVDKTIFTNCYQQAVTEGKLFTDEMSLLVNYGYQCRIVESESYNKKMTKPEDFKE